MSAVATTTTVPEFSPPANQNHSLAWALHYASQGFPIFPIVPREKKPATPHGLNDATTDEHRIRVWWAAGQGAELNIGLPVPDGHLVIDVDPRSGGRETFAELQTRGLPATRYALTGGGGIHIWLRVPHDLRFPGKLGAGIDLKAKGGYVVAPPSVHTSSARYSWAEPGGWNAPIADAPAWLLALGKVRGERAHAEVVFEGEDAPAGWNLEAAAAAVAPHFVRGHFNTLALGLGAIVAHRGGAPAVAESLVGMLVDGTDCQTPDAHVEAARKGREYPGPWGYERLRDAGVDESRLQRMDREWLPAQPGSLAALAETARATELAATQAALSALPLARPAVGVSVGAIGAAGDEQRSDLGNARRLVRLFGADLRYFGARRTWYCWDGARWKTDATGGAIRCAKATVETLWEEAKAEPDDEKRKAKFAWAGKCQERSRIMNLIALAESEPDMPVTADMLDSDPNLLNVQNGTLDLRTGELRAPDRALLMTKMCAAVYQEGARSELWERFIHRTTGGDHELAAYIQRALGYALFGAWREKMFWFGYGPPDGAKSTLLGAVGDVMGDYHVSASASTWMVQSNIGGNRGDVTRLLGARLVTTLEVKPNARFDPELMKKATGGDMMTAAAKFENEISFKPAFALWFGANDRPIIPDDDDGFWSRTRCVPFTQVVPPEEQDKALREKLGSADHAPAVLAWLVAGCLAWQRDGIGTCAAVEKATHDYRRDMNQAAGFFDEHCALDPNGQVSATQLRALYDTWCRSNGVNRPLRASAWRKRLLALGAQGGDDASRVNGERVWFGIRLTR